MNNTISNYTFNATAKTITFTDITPVEVSRVKVIKNLTTGTYIYRVTDPTLTISATTNVITFTGPNASMGNNDDLFINYDTPEVVGLTDTQLRAAPVPVSVTGGATSANQTTEITALGALLTELQLKADATETQPVSIASIALPTGASTEATLLALKNQTDSISTKIDALTTPSDTQPVNTGLVQGLTDAQLRASALPLPTGAATLAEQQSQTTKLTSLDGKDFATETTLALKLNEAEFIAKTGSLTETAPVSDTASSGLNGRLQRIAQRITSLISLFPTSLGRKASASSLATTLSTEDLAAITNLLNTYNGTFDAFYRQRMSTPETIFDSKQISNKQPQFFDDQQVSGSGTSSTYNTNQASTTLAVSNLTAGKRVRQTFRRFNYQPGKSMLIEKTFKIDTKKTGIKIKDGYFDDNNGLYFYTHSDDYGFGVRTFTSGVAVDNLIPQSSWNIDKLDGTGINNPSGLNLTSFQKALFFVDFEWLGVGVIAFGFFLGRKPVYCASYDTGTTDALVTLSTPNLPCRTEIENDGTGAAASTTSICCTVVSEGGLKDTGYPYAVTRGITPLVTLNDGDLYPLIAIRLKSTNLGSLIKILDLSISCTSTAVFEYQLLLNPTVTGTAFSFSAPADITNSSIEADVSRTSATKVSGGTLLYSKGGSQGSATPSTSAILNSDFALGSTIAGVSDIVVLVIRRLTGTTETFYATLNIKDQQ